MLPEPVKHMDIRQRIEHISNTIGDDLRALPGREQAGVLLMSNQLIDVASRTWGTVVAENPAEAPRESLDLTLASLIEARNSLDALIRWSGRNGSALRQLLSSDLCIMTLGYPLVPRVVRPMLEAWKTLWASRPHLGEAVITLRDWEAANGVEAVPRNREGLPPTDEELMRQAARFPVFFKQLKRG